MKSVVVGQGSCGLAAGAGRVFAALQDLQPKNSFRLRAAGCLGMCYLEPIVDLYDGGGLVRRLVRVKAEHAAAIAAAVSSGRWEDVDHLAISQEDAGVLARQTRIALRNCGLTDPTDIGDHIARGGYAAARHALTGLTPEEVVAEVRTSGLAGRGGAGFPTWSKWSAARAAPGTVKYFICNGDEGDPGAFMDRALLESDPHSVLEGMLIGAYAIGAAELIVYVRAEYPLAVLRLRRAVEQAQERGFFGDRAMGSSFSCRIHVHTGAGAFVCGEETALITSLEGRRGMPAPRPPYPVQRGYKGQPTCINNVETLANLPWIFQNGGAAFAAIGTRTSTGTKVFALAGQVRRGGLVEVPMGTPLREIVFGLGGGTRGGAPLKAVQLGGPSGGCLPESMLDTSVDYQALASTGAMMGSGGLVVMDASTCMAEMARFFLRFIAAESCGKCAPCRIGTRRAEEILTRIVGGEGRAGDAALLEELSLAVQDGALCGLGRTALNPVLTALRYFRDEIEAHIRDKSCPAGRCPALRTYYIIPKLCRNCRLCLKSCPVNCIRRVPGKTFVIDQTACIKCDACISYCPFDAIVVLQGGAPDV